MLVLLECHPSNKFEYEMSKTEINFLNTRAFKVGNKLRTQQTKLFIQQTRTS